jgi:hypothetical protein
VHTIPDARDLTEVEQELLRAAAGHGGILRVAARAETHGRAVRAGNKCFYCSTDREFAQRYLSAVPQLVELQLVREGTVKDAFELTNFGWQLVRKLERRLSD